MYIWDYSLSGTKVHLATQLSNPVAAKPCSINCRTGCRTACPGYDSTPVESSVLVHCQHHQALVGPLPARQPLSGQHWGKPQNSDWLSMRILECQVDISILRQRLDRVFIKLPQGRVPSGLSGKGCRPAPACRAHHHCDASDFLPVACQINCAPLCGCLTTVLHSNGHCLVGELAESAGREICHGMISLHLADRGAAAALTVGLSVKPSAWSNMMFHQIAVMTTHLDAAGGLSKPCHQSKCSPAALHVPACTSPIVGYRCQDMHRCPLHPAEHQHNLQSCQQERCSCSRLCVCRSEVQRRSCCDRHAQVLGC